MRGPIHGLHRHILKRYARFRDLLTALNLPPNEINRRLAPFQ